MSRKEISIEQNIIGLLLDDGSRVSQCNLSKEDFVVKSHKIIFESIQQVLADNNVVDIVSVAEVIERTYAEHIDMPYMFELVTTCAASPNNLVHFSELIKKAAELRQAKTIFSKALLEIDGPESKNVVSEAIRELMGLDKTAKKYEHSMKDAVRSAMEIYEEALERGGLIGITTGIEELDEALGGFHD